MSRWFDPDSPIMQALSRAADLVVVNVLWLVCCLPVVTAGAATTAMYRVLLDFVKNQDQGTVKRFFRAFRENFRPATLTLLVLLIPTALVAVNAVLIFSGTVTGTFMMLLCVIPALLLVFVYAWVFAYIACFDSSVRRSILNAFLLGMGNLPRTLSMAVLNLLPLILALAAPEVFVRSLVVWLFAGFSGLAYVNALILWPVFRKIIEAKEKEAQKEE